MPASFTACAIDGGERMARRALGARAPPSVSVVSSCAKTTSPCAKTFRQPRKMLEGSARLAPTSPVARRTVMLSRLLALAAGGVLVMAHTGAGASGSGHGNTFGGRTFGRDLPACGGDAGLCSFGRHARGGGPRHSRCSGRDAGG